MHDQFSRMFSDKLKTVLEHILIILERKYLSVQNSICFVEKHPIRLPACVKKGMTQLNSSHFVGAIYKMSVVIVSPDPQCFRH